MSLSSVILTPSQRESQLSTASVPHLFFRNTQSVLASASVSGQLIKWESDESAETIVFGLSD